MTAKVADWPTNVVVTVTVPSAAPMTLMEQLPDERAHWGSETIAFASLRLKLTSPRAVAGVTVAVQRPEAPTSTEGGHDNAMLIVAIAVTETLALPVLGW